MSTDGNTSDLASAWNRLWQQAQAAFASKVQADPKAYEAKVADFVRELTTARAHLDRMKAALAPAGNRPDDFARYNRLARQHYELSSRFYADAQPVQKPSMGLAPILIVLGLAVGVAATAWAAGAFQYATNLREQTALAAKELEARVEASRQGRTLQPATLPTPPPDDGPGALLKSGSKLLIGGILLTAGVLLIPQLIGRR